MRLLSVDRSFVGSGDETGRFRMNPASKLPVFGNGQGNEITICVGIPKATKDRRASWWKQLLRRCGFGGGKADTGIGKARSKPDTNAANGDQCLLIQPELRLDKCCVVRNDLSDTDVEVVTTARREHLRIVRGGFQQVPSRQPVKSAKRGRWSLLSGKLFGVGRAQMQ